MDSFSSHHHLWSSGASGFALRQDDGMQAPDADDDSIGNDEACLALGKLTCAAVVGGGLPLSAMVVADQGDGWLDGIFDDDDDEDPLPLHPSETSNVTRQKNAQQLDLALERVLSQAMCMDMSMASTGTGMFPDPIAAAHPSIMSTATAQQFMGDASDSPKLLKTQDVQQLKAVPSFIAALEPQPLLSQQQTHRSASMAVSASSTSSAPTSRRESFDAAISEEPIKKKRRKKRFTQFFFPFSLHTMLDHIAEANCGDDPSIEHALYISWLPNGNGFKIKSPRLFAEHTLPKHFDTLKYKSFVRQINIYGFVRNTSIANKNDPAYGAYFHPCFVRGRPDLCWQMKRQKIKGTGKSCLSAKNKAATTIQHASPAAVSSNNEVPAMEAKTVVGRAA